MSVNNATLTVFKSEVDAEAAVRQLARDGYDLSAGFARNPKRACTKSAVVCGESPERAL